MTVTATPTPVPAHDCGICDEPDAVDRLIGDAIDADIDVYAAAEPIVRRIHADGLNPPVS